MKEKEMLDDIGLIVWWQSDFVQHFSRYPSSFNRVGKHVQQVELGGIVRTGCPKPNLIKPNFFLQLNSDLSVEAERLKCAQLAAPKSPVSTEMPIITVVTQITNLLKHNKFEVRHLMFSMRVPRSKNSRSYNSKFQVGDPFL